MKNPEKKDLDRGDRLVFAIVGILVMFYGYGQTLRGKAIYTNWRGMDVPAQFVMILGALFLATAIFPWGRIRFLWNNSQQKKHRC